MHRRRFLTSSLAISALALGSKALAGPPPWPHGRSYKFSRTISREVLQNYLSRAISMEGLLNVRGDFADNVRMLRQIGAKYIGRSICLRGGEAQLLNNFDRASRRRPQFHAADRHT